MLFLIYYLLHVLQLKDYLSQLAKEACAGDADPQVPLGILRTKVMKRHTRKCYRYIGSLTIWTILGKVFFLIHLIYVHVVCLYVQRGLRVASVNWAFHGCAST